MEVRVPLDPIVQDFLNSDPTINMLTPILPTAQTLEAPPQMSPPLTQVRTILHRQSQEEGPIHRIHQRLDTLGKLIPAQYRTIRTEPIPAMIRSPTMQRATPIHTTINSQTTAATYPLGTLALTNSVIRTSNTTSLTAAPRLPRRLVDSALRDCAMTTTRFPSSRYSRCELVSTGIKG
jgi:hypothetical protein